MLITAGAIKMMAASVGMQFFNNYTNSQKNREIQAKQREFQIATAEHDFERARKAQAEAARIALELEAEVHKERVEDIQNNYDSLLENFAHGFAISNWPLNVLPFVMKGESFGSLISGTAKSISMHCIFTPSNCAWFNDCFYDDLDSRVEAEMNNNWNSQSTHPIVYYGGGWNRRENKHGISIPSLIDLDDIALLKNRLKNIPTMVITPYFDPFLHFKVQIWGMGKDSDMPFRIDIPNKETENFTRIFTYDYNKDSAPEFSEVFLDTTTKEFVAFLVSLIGFMADKYFWSMYGVSPMLPIMIRTKADYSIVSTEMKDLYSNLFNTHIDYSNSFDIDRGGMCSKEDLLSLYKGIKPLISASDQESYMSLLMDNLAVRNGIDKFDNVENYRHVFNLEDCDYLKNLSEEIKDDYLRESVLGVCEYLKSQIFCISMDVGTISFLDVFQFAMELHEKDKNKDIRIEILENHIVVALLEEDGLTIVNDETSPKCIILQYENLLLADRLQIKSNIIHVEKDKIIELYEQIKIAYEKL